MTLEAALIAAITALTAAVGVLFGMLMKYAARCEKDRSALWAYILRLERRANLSEDEDDPLPPRPNVRGRPASDGNFGVAH